MSNVLDEGQERDGRPKKHKKKKKKKHRDERELSDSEAWVEKTKDNLGEFKEIIRKDEEARKDSDNNCKKSSFNSEAPVKNWDAKPDLKTIGRSVTWDGSKGSNIAEQLRKNTEIRSWSGERSKDLERKSLEPRKRSAAQDLDAELDAGRVKKVKKFREDSSKWNEKNPFQLAQEHRNKGENFTDKPEFQRRHSDSFNRFDHWRHSDRGGGGRGHHSGNRHRFSDGGRDYRPHGNNYRDQRHHHHKDQRHNSFDRYKGSHHHGHHRK